jgi:hypothetical protein
MNFVALVKRKINFGIFIICFVILIASAACNGLQDNQILIFETIEKKELSGTGVLYEPELPGMKIVARADEAEGLSGLITDEAMQTLQTLDYTRYFVLAAFCGRRGTGGFGIQINSIRRTGNTVTVDAQLFEPAPDQQRTAVVTSPYHLVIVQKEGSWGQEISFGLFANHALFFSVSHPIP